MSRKISEQNSINISPTATSHSILIGTEPPVAASMAEIILAEGINLPKSTHKRVWFWPIIRGSLAGVDKGQFLAAEALGIPGFWQFTRIIFPQALPTMVPAVVGEIIGILKGTSLASAVAVPELFYTAEVIYGRNGRVVPVLAAVTLWYLIATLVLSFFQSRVERYLSKPFGIYRYTVQKSPEITEGKLPGIPLTLTRKPSSIALGKIKKSYGSREILHGLNLTVSPGEVLTIIGPSGSGKSTLLRLINGLEQPDEGLVVVDKTYIGYEAITKAQQLELCKVSPKILRQQRSHIGFVFQNFNLFPHLTVLENLMEAPLRRHSRCGRIAQSYRQELETKSRNILARVGLAGYEQHYSSQLSGGQQQRVAIARAIALDPSVLLLDEPTSALDLELVSEVLEIIATLAKENVTMVIVTHELGFAKRVSDRVAFMDDGYLVDIAEPEVFFTDGIEVTVTEDSTDSAGSTGSEHTSSSLHPRTRQFLDKVLH